MKFICKSSKLLKLFKPFFSLTRFKIWIKKASFSVAVNRWDTKTKSEVTDWFNIEVWDKQAEFAAEYIKKGRLVAIDGRIANRRWVDKQTNNERETFYVIANNIRLLGSKRDAETEAVLWL